MIIDPNNILSSSQCIDGELTFSGVYTKTQHPGLVGSVRPGKIQLAIAEPFTQVNNLHVFLEHCNTPDFENANRELLTVLDRGVIGHHGSKVRVPVKLHKLNAYTRLAYLAEGLAEGVKCKGAITALVIDSADLQYDGIDHEPNPFDLSTQQ